MDYMSNGLIVLDCVYLRNGMVSQERKVLLASRAWRMKYYTCVVFFYLSPKQFQIANCKNLLKFSFIG